MTGPLKGIRVVEMVGIGPCPFAAMMLADMGAEVIRIDRKLDPGAPRLFPILGTKFDVLARGRRSLAVDLKHPEGVNVVLGLVAQADVLLEGFRPGVMEKLGLGPDVCLMRNGKLVYGRITGWGQDGPLAKAAGHDLNYLGLTGLLPSFGRPDTPPPPPLNLVGDFGGGGMMAAFGVMCALLEARNSGEGQVVDAAMLDGSALLGAMIYGLHAAGSWSRQRGKNWIDGGAPYYDSYECADGGLICIAPIEPQFYSVLLTLCGMRDPQFEEQADVAVWPRLKDKIAEIFKARTRQEWCELLEGTDACFAPVLDLTEAPKHVHNVARGNFIEIGGVTQPAPAPRFSRTVGEVNRPPAHAGQHSREILRDWQFTPEQIARLAQMNVI